MTAIWYRARLHWEALESHSWFWASTLGASAVTAALFAAAIGPVAVPIGEIGRVLFDEAHELHAVLWEVRVPRVVGGAIVGAVLATAGTLMQTVVRNPLADPGLLGVTAGAGFAALLAIIFFPAATAWVPAAAFVGSLLTVSLLMGLAWRPGRAGGPLRLLLSGVAIQAVFFASTAMLSFVFADRAPSFAAFVVGSLNGLGWQDVRFAAWPAAIGFFGALLGARSFDLLLLDDTSAAGVGLAVRQTRMFAAAFAAVLAAGAVSIAGLVGFVGLVVPNAMRLLVGPNHRTLLPLAAIAGAILVVVADTAARSWLAPLELPVGALLAFVGGPYFLYLLWRRLG